MRNKVAKEIRKFLKQDQNLDVLEDRGIRGERIGEIEYQTLLDPEQKTAFMYRYVNPEKNFYRKVKKDFTRKVF